MKTTNRTAEKGIAKEMKYQVSSKKGSSMTFKFATYEEAADFRDTMLFMEKARAGEYPELVISEICDNNRRIMKEKAVEYSITAKKQTFEPVKVKSSADAAGFARNFYHEDILIYESLFIILLNRANGTAGYAKISQGGVCGTAVDMRIIAKYAIDALASGVILVHNHPSGNMAASIEDRRIASRAKDALRLLDVTLADSIIITGDGYYSMADEGILP